MAICGCIEPCNCRLSEDGWFAGRPQDGRRNTVLTGSGTVEDPYEISFVQSEFYRPLSGEMGFQNKIVVNNPTPGSSFIDPPNSIPFTVYESPTQLFITFPPDFDESVAVNDSMHFIGTTVTFAANATGQRWVSIGAVYPDQTDNYIIASEAQSGDSVNPTILSCSGFAPGLLDIGGVLPSDVGNPRIDTYFLQVSQNSGGSLGISNIRIWVTTV